MTPRPPHAISRRRALAPIAGLALAAAPLARTAAQPTQPGAAPLMTAQPDVRANRVNLDTGAVFGGPLTAAVFVPGRREPAAFLAA